MGVKISRLYFTGLLAENEDKRMKMSGTITPENWVKL
jgi:hypothetical protein